MPMYEMICPECEQRVDILAKITEYDNKVKTAKCEECNSTLSRFFDTPPNFAIGAQHTYNGQTKISGSTGKKEKARVPINIIDELPNGRTRVTRVGTKGDVDGD